MAKNAVIAGDYNGYPIGSDFKGNVFIKTGFWGNKKVFISKQAIATYEIIDTDTRKSGASAITRGTVGAVILGPVGLLAGASAKNKTDFKISLTFNDGKRSLIEIDRLYYEQLIKSLF